jgi:hypothetical protein
MEHEKVCKTGEHIMDDISRNLFGTRLNSSFLLRARFANGIGTHANSLTAFRTRKILQESVQYQQEFIIMSTEPERYPALYVIFTLLNAIRRGIERQNIWREFRRQKIALKPRLSFWIALCKEAGLIDDYDQQLRVTRQVRAWLNKTSEEQIFHLIESWQNAPKNRKSRLFRKKLLWKLKYDQRSTPQGGSVDKPLTQKDLKAINGLEALGLYKEGKLTAWGEYFIKGKGELPTPKPPTPCQIHQDYFIASLPQHIDLLWELEKHLRPASPGVYSLTKRALQYLQGDPHDLVVLLKRGLRELLAEEIQARLLDQPSLRVIEGVVLEFSHPAELIRLRRQPKLRQHVQAFLSPHHIFLSQKEFKTLLPMLKRRGVYLSSNEEPPETKKKRTHFPRKVSLQPVGTSVPKLELLEKYLQLQQAVDVLYRTPGYPAEQRRITPLGIEQRGEHTYVTAFCQTRRAQRLFRLDRMEIPGTY